MRQSEFFRWKYFPLIAQTRQIIISPPIICLNNASWFDHGLDKSSEAFSRSVSQMLKANPPHSFRRFIFNADSDQRLAFSAPTAFATLTPSNVRFVHLNATTEPITPRPHHRSSQLVQPLPRSFIATRLKNTGQPKGVGTIFLGGDMPHHSKPQAQRFVGSVENSTGRYRFLNPALATMPQTTLCSPCFVGTTIWAYKTIRPTQIGQIIQASHLSGKSLIEGFQ